MLLHPLQNFHTLLCYSFLAVLPSPEKNKLQLDPGPEDEMPEEQTWLQPAAGSHAQPTPTQEQMNEQE